MENERPGGREDPRARDAETHTRRAARQARSQVLELADAGREELADRVGSFARAVRSAREHLLDEEVDLGRYGDAIVERADRASRYLREHDASAIVADAESLARRRPLVFLGGCALVGLAIGRFLKATAPDEEPGYDESEASLDERD